MDASGTVPIAGLVAGLGEGLEMGLLGTALAGET